MKKFFNRTALIATLFVVAFALSSCSNKTACPTYSNAEPVLEQEHS